VLSEIPDEWARRVSRWHLYNKPFLGTVSGRAAPLPNDEYLLYQSIVGTWPMQVGSLLRSKARRDAYATRIKAYAIKAARESKLATSWIAPDDAYEAAFLRFIECLFEPARNPFTESLTRFLPPILRLGAFNSLSQLVLKATLPGVPDFYQGCEFWDLSLVDPDNRHPVDFAPRREALNALDFGSALLRWRDGWLKLWMTERLLALRNRQPEPFRGSYQPLAVEGDRAERIIAFRRDGGDDALLVVVSRLLAQIVRADLGVFWPGGACFGDTVIRVDGAWIDQFTGARISSEAQTIRVSAALARLPVAVLAAE
jgi:(1->4)-alpha-D-glucan 1-alpha-D-glucosylmutase